MRHFYIYEGESGECIVKEGEHDGGLCSFPSLPEAMAFVREQRGEAEVAVSRYDAQGRHVHTERI